MDDRAPLAPEGATAIPLKALSPWSPFTAPVWLGLQDPITIEEVLEARRLGRFYKEPVPVWNMMTDPPSREDHVARVAYLSILDGDYDPISIDVGVPDLHCHVEWIVDDGNHRHAAAIVRGDEEILAFVAGSLDHAKELLGVDI